MISRVRKKPAALAARFKCLAEPAHGFAHSNGERGNSLQALYARCGELRAILAACFGEKQLGIAENSGERIVELMAQEFTESFLLREIRRQERANSLGKFVCHASSAVQTFFDAGCGGG